MTYDAYAPVHIRLRNHAGPARLYRCIACGDPAAEWAWQHTGPTRSDGTATWGTSLDDYAPMCVPCHRGFDVAWAAAQRSEEDEQRRAQLRAQQRKQRAQRRRERAAERAERMRAFETDAPPGVDLLEWMRPL